MKELERLQQEARKEWKAGYDEYPNEKQSLYIKTILALAYQAGKDTAIASIKKTSMMVTSWDVHIDDLDQARLTDT